MQITKEVLAEKKEELLSRREELLAQANACNGAIEDIEYWLSFLLNEGEKGKSPAELLDSPDTHTPVSALPDSAGSLFSKPILNIVSK